MRLVIEQIPREEVLRYLGYHGTPIPASLDNLITDCIALTQRTIAPQAIFRRFPILESKNGIRIGETGLILKGASIRKHLAGLQEIYLLAVTIGAGMDKLIRTKMLAAPEEGLILDSCATAAVEAVADLTEAMIREDCAAQNESITWRFSPGYGDLPIETQADFLAALDTPRKIGVMVSEDMILTPFKSVTAVVGVTREATAADRPLPCETCASREHCAYREAGEKCWN